MASETLTSLGDTPKERVRVNNTYDRPYDLAPPEPIELVVLGCPYCIGLIYFEYRDYRMHWEEKHRL